MLILFITILLLLHLYYTKLFMFDKKRDTYITPDKNLSVSIVIAVRNEEDKIVNLLQAIDKNKYPQELVEIIIIDDDSQDKTIFAIESILDRIHYQIKILRITAQERKTIISGKKNALQKGILSAKNTIILTTDADCLPHNNWIQSMVSCYNSQTDMVCGFSQTNINWKKANLLQKFEYFDFLAMFFVAAGSINKNKGFSCSGQNLSYRKQSFLSVKGFETIQHLVSGDDVNLLQLFRNNNLAIKFNYSPDSFMKTAPIVSLGSFLNQRSRWASNFKWQLKANKEFAFYMIFIFILTILPWVIISKTPAYAILLILSKAMIDLYFLSDWFSVFQIDKNRLSFYFYWILLQPAYMIIAGILGQFNIFCWKK